MLDVLLTRRRVVVTGFILAGMGGLIVHPSWARSIGADVWNLPSLKKTLNAEEEKQDLLNEQSDDTCHRIEVKEAIIAELLAGRITLAEATDQFAELNRSRPAYMAVIRRQFPGVTDRERIARNVIAFAVPRADPNERDAVASRLEAELHLMLSGSATE